MEDLSAINDSPTHTRWLGTAWSSCCVRRTDAQALNGIARTKAGLKAARERGKRRRTRAEGDGAGQVAECDRERAALLGLEGGGVGDSGHGHDIISFSPPKDAQPSSPKVNPSSFNMAAKVPFGKSPLCPGTVVNRRP